MLIRCCGNGLWVANVVAASGGSSAALLRRCGGGCGKFERWCGVVLLWCCGCPALVPLQQLWRGWFCAGRVVGEGRGSEAESLRECVRVLARASRTQWCSTVVQTIIDFKT